MKAGEKRIFTKSGNEVQLLIPVPKSKPKEWLVERTSGKSAGKQMICRERCLLKSVRCELPSGRAASLHRTNDKEQS